MNMPSKRQGAFTLIELLVVITIIGILAALSIVSLASSRLKAQDTQFKTNLRSLSLAIEKYSIVRGDQTYPLNFLEGIHEEINTDNLGDELNPHLGTKKFSGAWIYDDQVTGYEAGENNLSWAVFVDLRNTSDNGPNVISTLDNITINHIIFESTGLSDGKAFWLAGPN